MLVPPNFVKFYLFFILAYAENFICLSSVVKKFEFLRVCFGGNPPFWYPKPWYWLPVVESSRTHFEVIGLEGQVLGLGLEASSPRKSPCVRLEDSTVF